VCVSAIGFTVVKMAGQQGGAPQEGGAPRHASLREDYLSQVRRDFLSRHKASTPSKERGRELSRSRPVALFS